MKKLGLMTGMVSLCAALLWSLPAAAGLGHGHERFERWHGRHIPSTNDTASHDDRNGDDNWTSDDNENHGGGGIDYSGDPGPSSVSVPEPGTLGLLTLGIGGMGLIGLISLTRRRKARVTR